MPTEKTDNNGEPAYVPEATVLRLPLYLNRLKALREAGVQCISSRALAEQLKIKAGQLRHDFHHFGGFSQPGHPYEVEVLIRRLMEIMALDQSTPYVIVGAGLLGQAIASYSRFEEDGFHLCGIFDINPRILGMSIRDIPVRDMDEMSDFVREKSIPIAVLAVPPSAAQEVADRLVDAGVRGIWNFAPMDLKVPEDVVVQDEFLSVGIMALNYKVKGLGALPSTD